MVWTAKTASLMKVSPQKKNAFFALERVANDFANLSRRTAISLAIPSRYAPFKMLAS